MSRLHSPPAHLIKSALDSFDEPFYLIRVADYSIMLANKAARALGVETARTCFALTHRRDTPCEGADHPCPMKQVIQTRQPYVVEHIHYKPDGSPYYAEVHGYPLYNEKGEVEYMVEYSIDITARKHAEEELRLLQRALEFSANGVVITDAAARIVYVNPAFTRLTGYTPQESLGQNPRIIKSGKHSAEFYAEMWKVLLNGEVWHGELINRKKDGSLYWERQTIAPIKDGRGRISHYVAIKEDITNRKNAEQEMERLASTDHLTGLANRRHFFHHAEAFFDFSRHPSANLSALMVDIDHFKTINDRYGHAVGDEVLCEIAKRLQQNLRPNDLIGRYGGEEFSIILPRTDCHTAQSIAERLRLAVGSQPVSTSRGAIPVTASFGIACLDTTTLSLDELLNRADQALYAAKNSGRNCCKVYQP